MKKILYIILIFTLASLASCDDWLDVKPKTEILADDLFQDEEGFNQALLGVYIGMTDKDAYGENLSWHFLEILAQQYNITSGSYFNVAEYNFKTSRYKSKIWNKQYNCISQVNQILEMVDLNESLLSSQAHNLIKGEALALRAFCHFDILRLYGHGDLETRSEILSDLTIPYVLKHSKVITHQKTYEETFALLQADLAEALILLEDDPVFYGETERSVEYEDATEGLLFKKRRQKLNFNAVQLLQARAYLWEGKKAEALVAAESAIKYINRSIGENFLAWANDEDLDELMNKEHLFNIDVTKLTKYMEGYYEYKLKGSENPNMLWQSFEFVNDLFNDVQGEGKSDIRYMNQHEKFDKDGDVQGYWTDKIRSYDDMIDGEFRGDYNTTIPMIKMSEAYLIAAECYANGEASDLAKAIESLNFLKEKRNILPEYYLDPASSTDEVNLAIMKEYRKEFIQEGQLFYFYKRRGVTVLPGYSDIEMDDSKYRLPYPDTEIELGNREGSNEIDN